MVSETGSEGRVESLSHAPPSAAATAAASSLFPPPRINETGHKTPRELRGNQPRPEQK